MKVKTTSHDGADILSSADFRRAVNIEVGPDGFEPGDGTAHLSVTIEDHGNGTWDVRVYDDQGDLVRVQTVEEQRWAG